MLIASSLLFLTGCNEPKQITGQEFMEMLARNPESMRCTKFVAVKDDKAILKVSEMSTLNQKKWKDTYFITSVDDLPKDWLKKNEPSTHE